MSDIDHYLTGLHDRIENLRENFDSGLASLFSELDQAREAMVRLQAVDEEYQKRLEKTEDRVAAQDELIETLNEEAQEAKSLQQDIRERELEIERLRSELESKNDLAGALRKQIRQAAAEASALKKELDEARQDSADAKAAENAEIATLKTDLDARRTMIKSLREDAERADTLEKQLEAKRESISQLEESIDQHVQTIADLRKSADAWKLKYRAVKGSGGDDIDETLTELPMFTDTEIDALKRIDQAAEAAPDRTVAIDMRDALATVRAQKAQERSR